MVGPFRTDLASSVSRTDRIIAYLGMTLRMWKDRSTEMARHHLRAKANPEIRFFIAQWHADPVDLSPHELFIVVGALWAAKNSRASVLIHRVRQRITETRTTNIERIAKLRQSLTNAAGR